MWKKETCKSVKFVNTQYAIAMSLRSGWAAAVSLLAYGLLGYVGTCIDGEFVYFKY